MNLLHPYPVDQTRIEVWNKTCPCDRQGSEGTDMTYIVSVRCASHWNVNQDTDMTSWKENEYDGLGHKWYIYKLVVSCNLIIGGGVGVQTSNPRLIRYEYWRIFINSYFRGMTYIEMTIEYQQCMTTYKKWKCNMIHHGIQYDLRNIRTI